MFSPAGCEPVKRLILSFYQSEHISDAGHIKTSISHLNFGTEPALFYCRLHKSEIDMNLKFFNDPHVIHHSRRPLAEFFGRFTHLFSHKHAMPNPALDCAAFPQVLPGFLERRREGIPDSMYQAMADIETVAAEKRPQFEAALHQDPDVAAFTQAVEHWLSQNPPTNGHPSTPPEFQQEETELTENSPAKAVSNGQPTNSLPLPKGEGRGEGNAPAQNSAPAAPLSIEIQNSKIPNPSLFPPFPPVKDPEPAQAAAPVPPPPIENQSSKIENPNSDFIRLARLSLVDYDLVRHAEAKRLHLRLPTLDHAVERARSLQDDADASSVPLSHLELWPEPILDAPALFDEIHDRYLHYASLPGGAAVVLTLWPGHAHAIKAFDLTPRIHLTSRKQGCGKSTVLSILAALCPRVLRTNNLKPAVLYRTGPRQPTVCLDEMDTYLHLYPELGGLLNASNDMDACVYRCEGHAIRAFKAYIAIALASIGPLVPTLRDRSIVLAMEEAPPGYPKARFDKRKLETETILGRKIARWAQDNFAAIAACDPVLPPEAYNRLADKWRPLFAIAQVIGGHWPQRVLEAFRQLNAKPEPAPDLGLLLLADIRDIFAKTGAQRLFSSALVDALCAVPERPWSLTTPVTDLGSARPINEGWLARNLRRFAVRSHNLRINGDRAKGYELIDFTGVFAKYLG
jgi:hypothetical protein